MEQKDNTMCALESNIKNKGENSYYYAHKYKFEDNTKDRLLTYIFINYELFLNIK